MCSSGAWSSATLPRGQGWRRWGASGVVHDLEGGEEGGGGSTQLGDLWRLVLMSTYFLLHSAMRVLFSTCLFMHAFPVKKDPAALRDGMIVLC